MRFTEPTVEDVALSWLGELNHALMHGPEIAPVELVAERTGFGETVSSERLRAVLQRVLERP